jgi:U3 small nucleolar RNA-associated protein 18
LFTVDAPLAEIGSDSDSEDDMPDIGRDSDEEDDEDGDEQDFEDSEKEDEDEDEEEEDEEDSGSDSAPEFDVASENEGEYEETGANAPKITVPKGVVDFDEEEINGKGKGKAVWHDAADERVNVDMEKDNRLKKLARGKKGGVVDGAELQKRLKQQYVHFFFLQELS